VAGRSTAADVDPDADPQPPDPIALRRRVLLTGALALALFLVYGYLLAALQADQLWVLPGTVILYVVVVRPLLRPVRDAVRLRRRLAYQAFLESRENGGG
jgi:small-conductance mechanosensitive channel